MHAWAPAIFFFQGGYEDGWSEGHKNPRSMAELWWGSEGRKTPRSGGKAPVGV